MNVYGNKDEIYLSKNGPRVLFFSVSCHCFLTLFNLSQNYILHHNSVPIQKYILKTEVLKVVIRVMVSALIYEELGNCLSFSYHKIELNQQKISDFS